MRTTSAILVFSSLAALTISAPADSQVPAVVANIAHKGPRIISTIPILNKCTYHLVQNRYHGSAAYIGSRLTITEDKSGAIVAQNTTTDQDSFPYITAQYSTKHDNVLQHVFTIHQVKVEKDPYDVSWSYGKMTPKAIAWTGPAKGSYKWQVYKDSAGTPGLVETRTGSGKFPC